MDFAQARYFGSLLGRFSSPDPLQASGSTIRPQSWNRYSYSYNNPLKYSDPTGLMPSDYVDEDGFIIGNDGTKETKLYFVGDEGEQDLVRENHKKRLSTTLSTLNSELELPDVAVRTEIGINAVKESNKLGGFQETGGQVIETANGQLAVPSVPGPVGMPGVDGGAEIDKYKAADPNLLKQKISDMPFTTYHIHPKGTKTTATGSGNGRIEGFKQVPSDKDIKNAANTPTKSGYHLQVGAGKSTLSYFGQTTPNPGGQRVQFYNGNGLLGSMSIEGFVKAGRRKK